MEGNSIFRDRRKNVGGDTDFTVDVGLYKLYKSLECSRVGIIKCIRKLEKEEQRRHVATIITCIVIILTSWVLLALICLR